MSKRVKGRPRWSGINTKPSVGLPVGVEAGGCYGGGGRSGRARTVGKRSLILGASPRGTRASRTGRTGARRPEGMLRGADGKELVGARAGPTRCACQLSPAAFWDHLGRTVFPALRATTRRRARCVGRRWRPRWGLKIGHGGMGGWRWHRLHLAGRAPGTRAAGFEPLRSWRGASAKGRVH